MLSLISRMKSEMKMPWNRDREWKVKWKWLEIEIEKWNLKIILENSRETRLSQVTGLIIHIFGFRYISLYLNIFISPGLGQMVNDHTCFFGLRYILVLEQDWRPWNSGSRKNNRLFVFAIAGTKYFSQSQPQILLLPLILIVRILGPNVRLDVGSERPKIYVHTVQ